MIVYEWFTGSLYPPALLEECAELYSQHYGTWSAVAPRAHERIRLSPARIRDWLRSSDSNITLGRVDGVLVGYAMAVKTHVPKYGVISWVTQLVVHEAYRRANIAKTLLFSTWGFSDHFAWGLLTANPYAVRALEKATRRRATPFRIRRNARKLLRVGSEHVPYVREDMETVVTNDKSRLNTKFFLDHSRLPEMIANASNDEKPWLLGGLEEGWEWFTFTFQDQQQISLTKMEIAAMLKASDDITRQAYSRMQLGESHAWSKHTATEVEFIFNACDLQAGATLLDVGSGAGRHAIELARQGIDVVGIDYVDKFIEKARRSALENEVTTTRFAKADARTFTTDEQFDAIVALYDVVGTYADDSENLKILRTIRRHLSASGYALISVMNLKSTEAEAKHRFSVAAEPDKLLELPPSNTMESTGDIFNPDYYLLDTEAGVVYRKEQFTQGGELPVELIVRDRRYSAETLTDLLREADLEPLWVRYVRAGHWRVEASPNTAKEVLALCRPGSD